MNEARIYELKAIAEAAHAAEKAAYNAAKATGMKSDAAYKQTAELRAAAKAAWAEYSAYANCQVKAELNKIIAADRPARAAAARARSPWKAAKYAAKMAQSNK